MSPATFSRVLLLAVSIAGAVLGCAPGEPPPGDAAIPDPGLIGMEPQVVRLLQQVQPVASGIRQVVVPPFMYGPVYEPMNPEIE